MPSPDIRKLFYSICMWNMTPDETLITNNDINK